MAVPIYLVKRPLKGRKRNGQREYRWALRWEDPETGRFRGETTGTADKTQAESLQKLKWAEVNGLTEPRAVIETPVIEEKATWQDCREALERAMRADNLRERYIEDALMVFDALRRMHPELLSPADITADMANE